MDKIDIELVVHCWSGNEVPIYHNMLQYQLSSLLADPPGSKLRYTLFIDKNDGRTNKVLDEFIPIFLKVSNVDLNIQFLDLPCLFRRSIGRDLVAKGTEADVVWFTDVDYVFGENAIDVACDYCRTANEVLVYPSVVMVNKTHEIGDGLLESVEPGKLMRIDTNDFEPTRYDKAIGGVQIVKGSFCRRKGYVHKPIGRRPVNLAKEGNRFKKCRGDASFRSMVGDDTLAVNIPNIYRIRHTYAGRDGGTVDHGKQK